uniref:Transposase n=1 Tax=Ascaris lumbricoides TaxID=6252 RepID=A0A0M3IH62_ASCLU
MSPGYGFLLDGPVSIWESVAISLQSERNPCRAMNRTVKSVFPVKQRSSPRHRVYDHAPRGAVSLKLPPLF